MSNKIVETIQEKLREFGLTTLAVDNSTSVFILTFMLFIFGVSGYNSMPKEAYPEITFPQIFVNTVYFGNSAADIENLITRPIEKEMASISEIKTITSSSLQDYSLIVAEFETDVDIEIAKQKIKDAVDKAKSELPNDLTTDPEVLDVNFSELPIMTVNISGDYTSEALKNYAEYLEDEIEDLKMISEVELKGVTEKEVEISVDIPKMESREVSFGDIENAIKSENITMSGGELVKNDFRRTIRVVGEFENVKQMEDMIVKSENQNSIYLRDIASVTFGYKDRTSIARSGELPVISLDVIKRSGENLLIAADEIKAIIKDAKANVLPDDITVQIFNDLSIQTKLQVDNLVNSIISGVILVVIVLLFFLGIRNSLFVGMAIPLSMLMGIMIMNFMGFTMNMVVLFGLILALGMLVDNAIVVVENIYRYMQNGYSGLEAAKYGTGEVALPIIVSTATTLAAFIPLAFWPGLMGSFMGFLPKTLIIVLSSSLFIALVINPVLTSVFMKIDERAEDKSVRNRKRRNAIIGIVLMLIGAVISHFSNVEWARNILVIVAIIAFLNVFLLRSASFFFQDRILPILENGYNSFIRFALKSFMPYALFAGMFGLLIFSLMLLGANMPKVTLFPIPDPIYVNAFVEMPMGTDINATDRIMKELEVKTQEIIKPYGKIVEASLSQIGENTSDPNAGPAFGASPNKARLTVSFVPAEDRGNMSSAEVMKKLREGLKGYAGVQIVVDQDQAGPPVGKPVNIEITGKEVNKLALVSDQVIQYLNKMEVPGIEELKKDVSIGKPELVIDLDRDAARRYGLSTFGIADAIRTAVFGKEISKFKQGEDEYPIQLRVDKKYRYNIDDLLNQKITFRNPANGQISQVPISAVASISYASTYDAIKRKDQERVITISSNVLDGYNPNEIVAELKQGLADYSFPSGYDFDFTGEQEQMEEEMTFLGSALLVAVFAILLIIVAQFNSIISPFIIILSILFSTIGVFLGYVFTNMEIVVVMTGVGIISLAGIVVNNAIVLIDYINLLIKRRREKLGYESMDQLSADDVKEAIINGGGTRLRPVLLTAITTILGLVPLAIGFNFDFFGFVARLEPNFYIGGDNAVFWGTMAWTVIYGLVFATFLTLVVVPVMYWLAYKMKMRVKELFGMRKKATA